MRRHILACVFLLSSANSVSSDSLQHAISASPTTCYQQVFKAGHLTRSPAHRIKSVSLHFDSAMMQNPQELPIQLWFAIPQGPVVVAVSAQCTGSGNWLTCASEQGDRFTLQQGPEGRLHLIVAGDGIKNLGRQAEAGPSAAPQPPDVYRLAATKICP